MTRIIRLFFSLGLFLIAWELIGRSGMIHISLFPPPTKVAHAFVEMAKSGELMRDAKASLLRAVLGLFIGSFVGVAIGLFTGRIEILNNYLSPLIQLFRPLPPVAIIPLVIVWFGIGELSKVFSISFAVFFPIWINTHIGVREIPKMFIWSAETLNVRGLKLLWKVIFPAALPFIIAGFRQAIATAFIMVFVSELAGASSGLGYQISVSHLAYRVDRMMAALVALGLLGALADFILTQTIWFFCPWLKLQQEK